MMHPMEIMSGGIIHVPSSMTIGSGVLSIITFITATV
jgi:hypothetical protein